MKLSLLTTLYLLAGGCGAWDPEKKDKYPNLPHSFPTNGYGQKNDPLHYNPNYPPYQPNQLGPLPDEPLTFHIDTTYNRLQPESVGEQIQNYVKRLHRQSPALSSTFWASVATFFMWQAPPARKILAEHFVCSWRNIRAHRVGSIFLASISHTGLFHILVNSIALLSFGPVVQQAIAPKPMWPLLLGAGLSGSLTYLAFSLTSKHNGGCLGASGITLALMATYGRMFPTRTMNLRVGPFPVRITSELALYGMFAWSLLGSLIPSSDGVAHAAHLGGLIFGCLYYEWWSISKEKRFF